MPANIRALLFAACAIGLCVLCSEAEAKGVHSFATDSESFCDILHSGTPQLVLKGRVALDARHFRAAIVISERVVTFTSGDSGRGILDFSGVSDALYVAAGGTLVLHNVTITGLASPNGRRSPVENLVLWPSIQLAPGSKLVLEQSAVTYPRGVAHANCAEAQQALSTSLAARYPSANITLISTGELAISNGGQADIPLRVFGRHIGNAVLAVDNSMLACQKPLQRTPAEPAAGSKWQQGSADSFTAASMQQALHRAFGWEVAAAAFGTAFAAAAATVWILFRRNAQLQQEQSAALESAQVQTSRCGEVSTVALAATRSPNTALPTAATQEASPFATRSGGSEVSQDEQPQQQQQQQQQISLGGSSGSGGSAQHSGEHSDLRRVSDGGIPSPGRMERQASITDAGGASHPIAAEAVLRDHHSHLLRMRMEGGLEGIELGPPLGRGSYGRVYKGRWQGVLVAIKVIEHSAAESSVLEVEGARESLLAASISHPNVIGCYKICNVMIRRPETSTDADGFPTVSSAAATAASSGDMSEASVGAGGERKRQPVARPAHPKSAAGKRFAADIEAVEAAAASKAATQHAAAPQAEHSQGSGGSADASAFAAAPASAAEQETFQAATASHTFSGTAQPDSSRTPDSAPGGSTAATDKLSSGSSGGQQQQEGAAFISGSSDAVPPALGGSISPPRRWSQDSKQRSADSFEAADVQIVEAQSSGELAPTSSSSDPGKQESTETWMLLEYADRGSLEQASASRRFHTRSGRGKLDMIVVCRTLYDIVSGLVYLHSLGLMHGDLKPANVLLKSSANDVRGFIAKLADFGMSRLLQDDLTHISTRSFGTVPFMAPELLRDGRLSKAADVYSFGVMVWSLLTEQRLHEGMTAMQVMWGVVQSGLRPEIPSNTPAAYADLMEACWAENPADRPTFSEVSEWISSLLEMEVRARTQLRQERGLGSPNVAIPDSSVGELPHTPRRGRGVLRANSGTTSVASKSADNNSVSAKSGLSSVGVKSTTKAESNNGNGSSVASSSSGDSQLRTGSTGAGWGSGSRELRRLAAQAVAGGAATGANPSSPGIGRASPGQCPTPPVRVPHSPPIRAATPGSSSSSGGSGVTAASADGTGSAAGSSGNSSGATAESDSPAAGTDADRGSGSGTNRTPLLPPPIPALPLPDLCRLSLQQQLYERPQHLPSQLESLTEERSLEQALTAAEEAAVSDAAEEVLGSRPT